MFNDMQTKVTHTHTELNGIFRRITERQMKIENAYDAFNETLFKI